jgi:heme oxygenase
VSLRSQLREATEQSHHRLEQRLDILNALADPRRRKGLMRRFWGLHYGAEMVLAPLLNSVTGLNYVSRSKLSLLVADIVAITGLVPYPDEPICVFDVPSKGAGLGLAYVLEGSALGGSVIHREMIARGASAAGLSFFNPYGRNTGPLWREFLAAIEAEARDEQITSQILDGARYGFLRAEAWLCDLDPMAPRPLD